MVLTSETDATGEDANRLSFAVKSVRTSYEVATIGVEPIEVRLRCAREKIMRSGEFCQQNGGVNTPRSNSHRILTLSIKEELTAAKCV
jgi:hypothetical protein